MEKVTFDPVLRWRNLSGSFYFGNRIIKPNEIFLARESAIPKAFMDTIILVGERPATPENPVPTTNQFSLRDRGPGWYDIVDENGKVINENALRKREAEALIESLAQ